MTEFISDRRGTEDGKSRWHRRYAWIISTARKSVIV